MNDAQTAQPDPIPTLPDGVHLHLPEAHYFGQDALGSTDLIHLCQQKWGWWWGSRHNPDRVEKDDRTRNYGSALHALMLEGDAAYRARFAVQPERPKDCVEKIDEMKKVLVEAGLSLKGTSGWRAADWAAAMEENLPDVPCWPNIVAGFERSLGPADSPNRKKIVTAVEDRMLRFMQAVAVDPARSDNKDIRTLFDGGGDYPPLAEVSIFHTLEDGTRRRWRIDRMFPRFDLDLKSLGNWSGRPLPWAVGDQIAKFGYDIQRSDYYNGRAIGYDYIRQGKVFGGSPEQRRWLATFPEKYPDWDWVWLFYQKPEPTGRAPVLFPVWDDSWINLGVERQPSPLRTYGQNKADKAMAFYRRSVAEFGLDQPWARVETVHYTDIDLEPAINIPPWIADDEPHDQAAFDAAAATEAAE